jgi:hypothetical protein
MRACWLVLVAAAGCDKVLGFDEVGVNPNETTVYGHGVTRTVINDSNRLATTKDFDFSTGTIQSLTAVLDDGTHSPIQVDTSPTNVGGFFFNRKNHTERYRLIVPSTTADPAPVEYQMSSGTLQLLSRSWGRSSLPQPPNETMPGNGSLLQYTLTGGPTPSASAVAYVESTGLWTETAIASGAQATAPAPYDWAKAISLYGPVYLLDGSSVTRDRAYFTLHDYEGTSYRYIVGYRFDDVVMKAGTVTMAGGQLYALPRDSCVHVIAQLAQASQAVMDAGLGTPTASWRLVAVPVDTMGPELSFVVVEGASSGVDVLFGQPFGGYGLDIAMDATVSHAVLAPGAAVPSAQLSGSTHWIPAQPTTATSIGTCNSTSELDAVIPMPTAPMIGGAPVDQDRTLEIDRTLPSVPLSWTPNSTASVELYRADLYEVIDNGGITFLRHALRFVTTNVSPEGAPVIDIDPKYMPAGSSYVFEVTDLIGFPHARDGDFETIDPTYSEGYAWTGVITVTK